MCLEEKQQIPILVFGLTRSGLEPTIYRTRGEHTNHYTTDAVIYIEDNNRFIYLTEIKNVGKPETDIDVYYSERDRTI